MTAPIFTDWQNQEGYEGVGRLIKRIAKGLPFLFTDSCPERDLVYYYCDKWLVEINGYTANRCILKKTSGRRSPYRDVDKESNLEDKFLTFNNKEIY